jgi:serine/threonine protein phosphatase PrpC
MFDIAWTTESYQQVCQDRVAVFSEPDRCVVVVADGAGGTGLGGQAATALVDGVRRFSAGTKSPEGWCNMLRQIDGQIGPGESTAVVVDLQSDGLCGASVGDSQAWIVKGMDITDLTARQHRKPLLGSGEADPVGFSHKRLDGLLIVATDGFCNYVKREEMMKVLPYQEFAILPKNLVNLVRLRSGALNDDVGIVVCRFRHPARDRSIVYSINAEDLV